MLLRRGDRGSAVAALRASLASLELMPPMRTAAGARSTGAFRPVAVPDQPAPPDEPGPATSGVAELGPEAEFDDAIDGAVRSFQQRRGLIVDGIVGPVTTRALTDARWTLGDRVLAYALSAPMSGDDVTALQVRLAEMGYNTGRADGIFGPLTDGSVRDFQRHRGLVDDGVFGAETYRELNWIGRMVTGGRPQYLREYQLLRQAGPRLQGKRIVLDPAHGGDDAGWTVDGVRAADLTYDIARRLEARMASTGMSVWLTRGPDDNPSVDERAQLANQVNADLMFSLHIDGSPSALANGIATFHFGTDSGSTSSMGETLAELVQRELVARTRFTDCRVHHRPWDILRLTRMPAIQVELGYLSNQRERESLSSEQFRDVLTDGLLVAVKRLYLQGQDDPHTGTFTFSDLLAHERSVRDSA